MDNIYNFDEPVEKIFFIKNGEGPNQCLGISDLFQNIENYQEIRRQYRAQCISEQAEIYTMNIEVFMNILSDPVVRKYFDEYAKQVTNFKVNRINENQNISKKLEIQRNLQQKIDLKNENFSLNQQQKNIQQSVQNTKNILSKDNVLQVINHQLKEQTEISGLDSLQQNISSIIKKNSYFPKPVPVYKEKNLVGILSQNDSFSSHQKYISEQNINSLSQTSNYIFALTNNRKASLSNRG
ncbi:Cyclic nucleotide-binding protein [Pseudocohnilembus persalinus]|uniref:Cyclic nucleotide-binding protein n=1 Tax=Pseudocohnilembus persalinus TaxID=266149 RepID=A0A0V0QH63_PSEPJ|nr:Cyclic nucleotide-binding protein [Pseudocohnilembus persalinus]|eukprot:KRX01516.1 Cyclic nucleotide-binding protein [Pseudocohnilembus persalinus]